MRIALVGLGNAGFNLHLPALAGIPAAHVIGACDPDASRRDRAHAAYKTPVFPDFESMMGSVRADVVIVGTPPDTHAHYCLEARGAHVICEKPFVSSLEEADQVLDAAEAAGRFVALNHEFREMPIFRALRDEIAKPDVGDVVFAQVWQLMDLPPWAEPGWRGQMLAADALRGRCASRGLSPRALWRETGERSCRDVQLWSQGERVRCGGARDARVLTRAPRANHPASVKGKRSTSRSGPKRRLPRFARRLAAGRG